MVGGYKIIDLQGKSITTTATTIDGIFDAIEGSFKAIMLTGVLVGSTEYKPYFPEVTVSSDDFILSIPCSADTIKVEDDDKVTLVEAE